MLRDHRAADGPTPPTRCRAPRSGERDRRLSSLGFNCVAAALVRPPERPGPTGRSRHAPPTAVLAESWHAHRHSLGLAATRQGSAIRHSRRPEHARPLRGGRPGRLATPAPRRATLPAPATGLVRVLAPAPAATHPALPRPNDPSRRRRRRPPSRRFLSQGRRAAAPCRTQHPATSILLIPATPHWSRCRVRPARELSAPPAQGGCSPSSARP